MQPHSKNWAQSSTNNALGQVVTGSMNNSCNCQSLNNYKKCAWSPIGSFHPQRHAETNLPSAAMFSNTKGSMVLSDSIVRKPSSGWLICKAMFHWQSVLVHPCSTQIKHQELLLTTKTCTQKVLLRRKQHHQYCIGNSRAHYFHKSLQLRNSIYSFLLPLYHPAPQASSLTHPSLTRVSLDPNRELFTQVETLTYPLTPPILSCLNPTLFLINPNSFFPGLSTLPSETPFLMHINSSISTAVCLGSTPFISLIYQNHITPPSPFLSSSPAVLTTCHLQISIPLSSPNDRPPVGVCTIHLRSLLTILIVTLHHAPQHTLSPSFSDFSNLLRLTF